MPESNGLCYSYLLAYLSWNQIYILPESERIESYHNQEDSVYGNHYAHNQ